jgi:hypothetical protein
LQAAAHVAVERAERAINALLAQAANDPTGNNTQGRVTVVFRGNWAQATDVARTNVQGLELVEVA